MNDALIQLYSSKWTKFYAQMQQLWNDNQVEIKPTNPLLLQIDNEAEFRNADIRIMFFGQETNGWYENADDINSIRNAYQEFFGTGYCFSYGGQFWNGVSRLWTMLEEKFPNKKMRFVWNNIVKIGKANGRGMPPDYIYQVERNNFFVIKEEIRILKPNVIIFLSGPNYDRIIHDNFGQLNYEPLAPYSGRQLSKVSLDNVENCFRTYHPNYLWRNDINSYFNRILDEIKI